MRKIKFEFLNARMRKSEREFSNFSNFQIRIRIQIQE